MAAKSPITSPSSSTHRRFPLPRSLPPRCFLPPRPLRLGNGAEAPRAVGVRARAGNPSYDGSALKGSPETPPGAPISVPASSSSASLAIDFLTLCHRLKTTKRKGWINHGIKGPESISDHMYRMALMALIAGDLPGVNRERCMKIAIVHDIAEAIVGDITPSDGVPKAEKSRLEQAALNEMCEVLGGGLRADEIKELWAEYENNSSQEASLVKDFDKVEMILQALEYETAHGKILDEFFLSTAGKFQTDVGKSWAAEVISRRNRRLAERI